MVERILAGSPGRDVLDVGCGTGIAARLFRAAGCRVLGVDVDERMAELARADGFDVEVARFEEWLSAGRTFDVVTAGQAWHWVDPVLGAAQAARVLRPGGRLAVFWNAFALPAEVRAGVASVYRRVLPEFPMFGNAISAGADAYSTFVANAMGGMRETGVLGEPAEWRFGWDRDYTRDEWLDGVPTGGGYHQLAPEQRAALLDGIGAAIDAVGGGFRMHYDTVVVTTTRIPSS